MAYNSPHTGPEIDAAVEMLGQIQEARDSTSSDLAEVKALSTQIDDQFSQVSAQAATVIAKAGQVEQHAVAVEQAREAIAAASATAVDSKDAAVLAADAALASREAAIASEQAASQSQYAAGLSEQISAEKADLIRTLAQQVSEESVSAQLSADIARQSAEDAAAVVTGGTAALAPEPGKIPLANSQGKIDSEWLGDEIARSDSLEIVTESLENLADNTDPESGAAGIGFDRGSVSDVLTNVKGISDYIALRAYSGFAKRVIILKSGIAGEFRLDASDLSSLDNGGTIIVGENGTRWKRFFTSNVSVAWFGARGDYLTSGAFDDAAFSAAAKAAPAVNNISGAFGTTILPRAPVCSIDVPDGSYGFQSTIDVDNKEVKWVFSTAARIQGDSQKRLNGSIVRPDGRITKQAYGTQDYATGLSVAVDAIEFDKSPGVTGITKAEDFNSIPSHDSVGLFVGNYSKPALHRTTSPCVFTATTVRLPAALNAEQLLKIRRGMTIDTLHSPRWVGLLDSWSPDGFTLTVTGWYLYQGAGASTPPNTAGVGVGGNDRAWGVNIALSLTAGGYSYQGIAQEISVYNYIGDSDSNLDVEQNRVWGVLSATGGGDTKFSQAAFIAKGNWIYGFAAHTHQKVGFYARANAEVGFKYHGGGDALLIEDNAYAPQITMKSTGQVVFGNDTQVVNGGRVLDFKTSGTGLAYDGRISVRQGGVSVGQALWDLYGASFTFSGHILPSADLTKDIGSVTAAFNNIYVSAVRARSQVVIGSDAVPSSSRIVDFKTSGLGGAYDSRIIASGGDAVVGNGTIQILGAVATVSGVLRPTGDNTRTLGTSSNRWNTIYAGTSTISTSDERLKEDIDDIPEDVLDAWRMVDYKKYRFKDAVEIKGDSARVHFGVIAQRVKDAFESKGIDPFAYGILCHDVWDGQPEITEIIPEEVDSDGVLVAAEQIILVQEFRAAGDRYSIRYDEAYALEMALMRRAVERIERRLLDLEGSNA